MPDDSIGNKAPDGYGPPECILDRILVRRVPEDTPTDGFTVPEKFRQHSNWGTVELIGTHVVLGGEVFQLTDFVNVGDLVKYGEYTAEAADLNDPDIFLVRIQDIRLVRKKNG